MDRPATSKSRGICRYYNTPRGCFAADKCKFKHGEHEPLTPYDKSKVCRYFATGYCKRGESCWFRHVDPANQMTSSHSEALTCAICMEEPVTFGLLTDCSHVFCLDCIRNWRGQDVTNEVAFSHMHKKCPYCRVPSKFIVPSSHFHPSGHPGKVQIIKQYKASLKLVDCKYFKASESNNRYCPFGRDCMYRHVNEDGTPYVFRRGVDYHMRQRERRSNGVHFRQTFGEVMTHTVFEYIRDMRAIFAPTLPPSETGRSDESASVELSERQVPGFDTVRLGEFDFLGRLVSASGPNFGMSTPPPAILLPTPSSTLETAFENPFPSPEPVLPAILPADVPFSDPALLPLTSLDHSGNPSLVFGTVTNADTEYGFGSVSAQPQPQIYQGAESPPQAPVPAAATTAGLDSIPLHQLLASAHDTHLPTLRPSEGAGPRDNTFTSTRSSLPANHDEHYPPTISQSQIAESHPPEVEMDSTSCPRSPTSDHVSAGMLTARQQEPPFMTDGRGRVVWSHSGVKRGDSPLASRGQERVSVNPGDISSTDTS